MSELCSHGDRFSLFRLLGIQTWGCVQEMVQFEENGGGIFFGFWGVELPNQVELAWGAVLLFLSGGLGFAVGTANYPTQAELEWGTSHCSSSRGGLGSLVVQQTTPVKRS